MKRFLLFGWGEDDEARDIPRGGITDFLAHSDSLDEIRGIELNLTHSAGLLETQIVDTGRSEWPIELVWISATEWAFYDDERLAVVSKRMFARLEIRHSTLLNGNRKSDWLHCVVHQGEHVRAITLRVDDNISDSEIHVQRRITDGVTQTYKIYILEDQDGGRDGAKG